MDLNLCGWDSLVRCYKHGNGPSDSTKVGKFREWLGDCQLVKGICCMELVNLLVNRPVYNDVKEN